MLVDSNVSLHILQPDHPQHDTATGAIRNLAKQGEPLYIVPQNLVEVWTVATKPIGAGNGLGMSTEGGRRWRLGILKVYLWC